MKVYASEDKIKKSSLAVKSNDLNNEYIKRLEEELLTLKIKNAYLKGQRRLCSEEEIPPKKRRELYTVSEENSSLKIFSQQ